MRYAFCYRKKYSSMKGRDDMFSVKKNHILGTALPLNLYNKLVHIAGEKNMSLSEVVLLSVAMQLPHTDIKLPESEKTPKLKKVVTVRASSGLEQMVNNAAKELGCSKSKYIAKLVFINSHRKSICIITLCPRKCFCNL